MNSKKTTFVSLLAVAMFLASCGKDDKNFSDQLSELKSVTFPEQGEQVITSTPTGRVQGNKLEVIETVKVQQTLEPSIQKVDGSNLAVILPGSVLDGESFLNGSYNNLIINNPKEIVLSTTLQGPKAVVKVSAIPTVSDVREKLNTLISQNKDAIRFESTPTYLTYMSNEVTTQESFSKSFGIHANVQVLKGLIKANFKYEEKSLTINSKKYVLIKVRQVLYNVAVDPKSADEWGDIRNIGSYEPVYISSVDYGRVAHLLIETSENSTETSKTIQAGISVGFPKVGGGIDYNQQEVYRKYFRDHNIQIMIAGGPLSTAKTVNDYDSFINFLRNPNEEDLVKASAPIGYNVRTLKDNREVTVRTMFTEQRFNYK